MNIDCSYIREYLHGRRLVLYGMGTVSEECQRACERSAIPIAAYTTSGTKENYIDETGKRVLAPQNLSPKDHYVLIAVRQGLQHEIIPIVRRQGFRLTEDYTVPWAPEDHPVDWNYNGVPVGKFTPLPEPFIHLIREDYSEIIRIGRYCSINGRAYIKGNHAQMLSTNGFLFALIYSDAYNNSDDVKNRGVLIGNDVWIGANAFINSSKVHCIGDGAIIGAGAVVTHDVPPYAVVCGVPARVVKYRFTPEQIDILLRVKWWDQSDEWLFQHREYLVDMEKFFSHFKNADGNS